MTQDKGERVYAVAQQLQATIGLLPGRRNRRVRERAMPLVDLIVAALAPRIAKTEPPTAEGEVAQADAEIIQADRECAARYLRVKRINKAQADDIRDGYWDESEYVQNIARHRLASRTTETEAVTALREAARLRNALESAAHHCPQCEGTGSYGYKGRDVACEFCEIARAALNAERANG